MAPFPPGQVLDLDTITPDQAGLVGAKAFTCARLRRAGFPVPDGFVVLEGVPPAALPETLAAALTRFPADVRLAVRSSGTLEDTAAQSFAGIHLTLLDVPPADLPQAVQRCLASVASGEAAAYRAAHGLGAQGGMAVLVQRMVDADVAGVAFSLDPTTGERGVVTVNASWGLGQAVVSGRVEPDEFRIRTGTGEVLSSRTGSKAEYLRQGIWYATPEERRGVPSLTVNQLRKLADLVERVERFLGAPQDVEWCLQGGAFFIVQSRPITPAAPAGGGEREWSRANALEGLPDLPLPQVSDTIVAMVNRAMRQLFPEFWAPDHELGPIATTICGRPYYNLSQFRHMCRLLGQPAAPVLAQFGGVPRPEDAVRPRLTPRAALRLVPALTRLARIRLQRFSEGPAVARRLAKARARLHALRAQEPDRLSDHELWERVRIPDDLDALMGGPVVNHGIAWALLRRVCRRAAHTMDRLLNAYLSATEKTNNSQQGFALLDLAGQARAEPAARAYFMETEGDFRDYRKALAGTRFLALFDLFLRAYGHCATFEKDWSLPRWAEDPAPLLHTIAMHVRTDDPLDTATLRARQQRELREAWAAFTQALGPRRSAVLAPLVQRTLEGMRDYYLLRESGRFENAKLVAEGRRWHLALARRMVERGWIDSEADYFYLTLPEIERAVHTAEGAAACRASVQRRRADQAVWQALDMPMLLRDGELPALLARSAATSEVGPSDRLGGTVVSRGTAAGPVVVIRTAAEFSKMRRSAIIVAPTTDPSWTPILTLAAGVITEIGGTLSHAATLARELSIPAVSNVTGATKLLRDGDHVVLDAVGGVVQVTARAGAPERTPEPSAS